MENFMKPNFKTFRTKEKEKPANSSFATSYKSKILLEKPISPEKQTREFYNRLENAQKRIKHIENDQKSVKRLINSLRTDNDDSITADNVYLIEKIQMNKSMKKTMDDVFFESFTVEEENNQIKNDFLQEILLKMNMFKKTYGVKSNLERALEYIKKKIERNQQVYFDFLNENNITHLKIFIQILYDAIESLIYNNSKLFEQQDTQKNAYEQKSKEINEFLIDKMSLIENLQNEKILLNKNFLYMQKVIEEIVLHLENNYNTNASKEKPIVLEKIVEKLKGLYNKDYKSLDFSIKNDSQLTEPNNSNEDVVKIKSLETEILNLKDMLLSKEKRDAEYNDLKQIYTDLKRKYESKEYETLDLQKKLENTRKEISALSKDLIRNSHEKEDMLKKISQENEDLMKNQEFLIKENKVLEKKFEDQLIIFKSDLQKAWKSVLDLTEKKNILENEKDLLLNKYSHEDELKDKHFKEEKLQEIKLLNEHILIIENRIQDLTSEKSLLEEKLGISNEKLISLERREKSVQIKNEGFINEYRNEIKKILILSGNSLKDLKLTAKILSQIGEILSKNHSNQSIMLLREDLAQKKEEILQRFSNNTEEFHMICNTLKSKYELNLCELEDFLNISLNFDKNINNKSFSEMSSMKSYKNIENVKKEKLFDENLEMLLYLQACSLENMLEQIQNNEENSKFEENINTEEEKNNLSFNAELEKINELTEDDETHTQPSIK